MPPSASPPPTGSPQSQDLPQLLENAAQQVSRVLTRQLADICGLALVEWRVLVTVGQHDGVSSSGVAELTDLDKVKVSRALSGLVILGLVRKSDDPRDGRAHLLRLTQRGRVVHQRTQFIVPRVEELLAAQLTQGEWRALRRSLEKLQAYAGSLEGAGGAQ